MGRAVVTRGHSSRRLRRTIRKLEASVEFSSKESSAKAAEQKYTAKVQQSRGDEDSPVQDLRNLAAHRKGVASS